MSVIPAGFKPMLSGKAPDDLSKINFPVLVSPKLDGIRCVIFDGVAYSRNLKPIPNKRVQAWVRAVNVPSGMDGELISGPPTAKDVWNRSQSCVMKADSLDEFTFHAFDNALAVGPFKSRFSRVKDWALTQAYHKVQYVPHYTALNADELRSLEERWIKQGYEGAMIRSRDGAYKYGRSTTKEGHLLKLKRFEDAEATVIGVVEKLHNANEAKKDELGRTKRSSAKAGKVKTGMMGALVCVFADRSNLSPVEDAVTFEIGTGFTDVQRRMIWHNRKDMERWRPVKFKYQGLTPDGKPRFPVFLGFRDARDM